MRAVNLLPVGERARGPAKVPDRASHIVLGVLGGLVLAVLVVVVTQNQITDRSRQIAEAKQETETAEQRSASLGAFGEFAEIKRTRVQSVSELAKARFDYERLMRELALVLPKDTWVTTATAASTAPEDGTAPAAGTTTAPAGGAAPSGPSLKLGGCAKTQSKVAETMVRLRNMHRAEDVTLVDSTRPAGPAAGAGAPSSSSSSSSSGSTSGATGEGCGDAFVFNVTIAFAATPDDGNGRDGKTPVTLGGGS